MKSGGASVGGLLVVFELTELDVVEDVEVAREDGLLLEDVAALEDVDVLEGAVVLEEEAFCAGLG